MRTLSKILAGGASAAALCLACGAASAAPVDLAAFDLEALSSPALSATVETSANSASGSSSYFGGDFFLTLDAGAPYGATDVTLTLTDAVDFSALNATSVSVGYDDDGAFADALFQVDSATDSYAGMSDYIYVVLALPDGVQGDVAAGREVNFTSQAQVFQTRAIDVTTPVPLPAGGVLLLSALAGAGALSRRRR